LRSPARPHAAARTTRLSGPLRSRSLAAAAAAALLAAAVLPGACGERRDERRLAALEAGIASAQASLSVFPEIPLSVQPPPGGAPRGFALVGAAGQGVATAAIHPAGPRPVAASEILGAGPDALRRWFGDPDLRRSEGDAAEVRLYLGPGCALDVVLYAEAPGGAGGGLRVAHAVARAEGAAAVTEGDCLRGIAGGGGGVGGTLAAGHTPGR
jgi:hypothetical protein